MGEGVDDIAGVLEQQKGLREKYGPRVFDTPIAEKLTDRNSGRGLRWRSLETTY